MKKAEFAIKCLVSLFTTPDGESALSFIPYLTSVKEEIERGKFNLQIRSEEAWLQLSGAMLEAFYLRLDSTSDIKTGNIVEVTRTHLELLQELRTMNVEYIKATQDGQ